MMKKPLQIKCSYLKIIEHFNFELTNSVIPIYFNKI